MRSLAATANPVASASSDVCSACTTSTSGIAATGLKKCSPTTRSGCCRSAAIALTDSALVLVARIAVGAMTVSSSANTRFFRSRISVTASMTRSHEANSARSVVPWTEPSSRAPAAWLIRPVRREPVHRRLDRGQALVDPLLVEVPHDDRYAEPLREQRRDLRRHETGADDADARDGLCERPVGRAGGLLATGDQPERVHAGPHLVAHDQVGERLVLGRERVGRSRSRAAATRSSARPGAGRDPATTASSRCRAAATAPSHSGGGIERAPLDDDLARSARGRPSGSTPRGSRTGRGPRRRARSSRPRLAENGLFAAGRVKMTSIAFSMPTRRGTR